MTAIREGFKLNGNENRVYGWAEDRARCHRTHAHYVQVWGKAKNTDSDKHHRLPLKQGIKKTHSFQCTH